MWRLEIVGCGLTLWGGWMCEADRSQTAVMLKEVATVRHTLTVHSLYTHGQQDIPCLFWNVCAGDRIWLSEVSVGHTKQQSTNHTGGTQQALLQMLTISRECLCLLWNQKFINVPKRARSRYREVTRLSIAYHSTRWWIINTKLRSRMTVCLHVSSTVQKPTHLRDSYQCGACPTLDRHWYTEGWRCLLQTTSWLVSVQVGQSAIWCRDWHPGRRQPQIWGCKAQKASRFAYLWLPMLLYYKLTSLYMLKKQRQSVAFARYWSWYLADGPVRLLRLSRNVLMHHEMTSQPVGEPHLGKVLCYFSPCTYYLRSDYNQNSRKRHLFPADTGHCRTL